MLLGRVGEGTNTEIRGQDGNMKFFYFLTFFFVVGKDVESGLERDSHNLQTSMAFGT